MILRLPRSFSETDFDKIALITGIIDELNIPTLEERYICHGLVTKAFIKLLALHDTAPKITITISGSSESKFMYQESESY